MKPLTVIVNYVRTRVYFFLHLTKVKQRKQQTLKKILTYPNWHQVCDVDTAVSWHGNTASNRASGCHDTLCRCSSHPKEPQACRTFSKTSRCKIGAGLLRYCAAPYWFEHNQAQVREWRLRESSQLRAWSTHHVLQRIPIQSSRVNSVSDVLRFGEGI